MHIVLRPLWMETPSRHQPVEAGRTGLLRPWRPANQPGAKLFVSSGFYVMIEELKQKLGAEVEALQI